MIRDNTEPTFPQKQKAPFDVKSASISGLGLVLKSADMREIACALDERFNSAAAANTAILIDVSSLSADAVSQGLELNLLLNLLRKYELNPVGIVGATGLMLEIALSLGLSEESDIGHLARRDNGRDTVVSLTSIKGDRKPTPAFSETAFLASREMQEIIRGHRESAAKEIQVAMQRQLEEAVALARQSLVAPPMIVDKPLRSGQRVYARGGDVIVLSMVSHGAEVIADGNVHVYGALRGRAIAGASGNEHARIFASVMEPDLYSIAGIYSTTEKPLPSDVQGRQALIWLEGEKLIVQAIKP